MPGKKHSVWDWWMTSESGTPRRVANSERKANKARVSCSGAHLAARRDTTQLQKSVFSNTLAQPECFSACNCGMVSASRDDVCHIDTDGVGLFSHLDKLVAVSVRAFSSPHLGV